MSKMNSFSIDLKKQLDEWDSKFQAAIALVEKEQKRSEDYAKERDAYIKLYDEVCKRSIELEQEIAVLKNGAVLTVANWVQPSCRHCEIEKLKEKSEPKSKLIDDMHAEIRSAYQVLDADGELDIPAEKRRPLDSLISEALGQQENEITELREKISKLNKEVAKWESEFGELRRLNDQIENPKQSFGETPREIVEELNEKRWGGLNPSSPVETKTKWDAEDVPALCWVRHGEVLGEKYLVSFVKPDAVVFSGGEMLYSQLLRSYEWSSDLKNWKPCTKESLS